jgi:hypothetical protein
MKTRMALLNFIVGSFLEYFPTQKTGGRVPGHSTLTNCEGALKTRGVLDRKSVGEPSSTDQLTRRVGGHTFCWLWSRFALIGPTDTQFFPHDTHLARRFNPHANRVGTNPDNCDFDVIAD